MGRECSYGKWVRSRAAGNSGVNEEKNVDRAGTSLSIIKGALSLLLPGVYRGGYPASSVLLMSPQYVPGNVSRPKSIIPLFCTAQMVNFLHLFRSLK